MMTFAPNFEAISQVVSVDSPSTTIISKSYPASLDMVDFGILFIVFSIPNCSFNVGIIIEINPRGGAVGKARGISRRLYLIYCCHKTLSKKVKSCSPIEKR